MTPETQALRDALLDDLMAHPATSRLVTLLGHDSMRERLDALIAEASTPDARLREALEDMCHQFAYWGNPGLSTGGLSTLEDAFDVLGWDDPHPCPRQTCDEPGCAGRVTCGWPTRLGGTSVNGGYRRTCGPHMRAAEVKS